MKETIKKSEDNDKEIIYRAYLKCKDFKSLPNFSKFYNMRDSVIMGGTGLFYIFSVYLIGVLDTHKYLLIILMLTCLFIICSILIGLLVKKLFNDHVKRLKNALLEEGIITDDPFLGLKYLQGQKLTIALEKQHLNSTAGMHSLKDSFKEDLKTETSKIQFLQFPVSIFLTLVLYGLDHTSFCGNFPLGVIVVASLVIVLFFVNFTIRLISERVPNLTI